MFEFIKRVFRKRATRSGREHELEEQRRRGNPVEAQKARQEYDRVTAEQMRTHRDNNRQIYSNADLQVPAQPGEPAPVEIAGREYENVGARLDADGQNASERALVHAREVGAAGVEM